MAHPEQEALLDLQQADTESDQLLHKRSHLPARQAVSAAEKAAVAAKQAHDALAKEVAELVDRQGVLEKEIGASEKRADQIDARMRSGDIVAARDIVKMQEEIEHLRAHAEELETEAVGSLEAQDEKDVELEALATALAAAVETVRDGRGEVTAAEQQIDARLREIEAARAAKVALVPEALMVQYEHLRKRLGGVGAARLEGDQCTGCHLHLSPYDMEQIHRAKPEDVIQCESCGRILVR